MRRPVASSTAKSPAAVATGWALFAVAAFAGALIHGSPLRLYAEEVPEFLNRAGTLDPWAGYLQLAARLMYIIAKPFGDGVLAAHVVSATVIAASILFLVLRLRDVVPSTLLRATFGLSLVFMPLVAPYNATLNVQWWLGFAALAIALSKPRRYDAPLLVFLGLTGAAACLVLPVFRDRRGLALGVAVAIQGVVYLAQPAHPFVVSDYPHFYPVAAGLGVAMLLARLPPRVRLGFLWVGLVWLGLGLLRDSSGGQDRYLAGAWAGIYLGVLSIMYAVGRWLLCQHEPVAELHHPADRARSAGRLRATQGQAEVGRLVHDGIDVDLVMRPVRRRVARRVEAAE